MAFMTLIVDSCRLAICGERGPVIPVSQQLTNVACLSLPSFVSDEVFGQALSSHGKVLFVNAGLMSGRRGELTLTCFIRMEMSTANPIHNYLRAPGHRVAFDYRS
ncbi:hypothetical protein HPB49_026222 [Dermacentor silvarum]|nr:hypothetical protein HPB49_026222 [Dermacentor silvarum]